MTHSTGPTASAESDREWRPSTDDGSQGRRQMHQEGQAHDRGPKPKLINALDRKEMSWQYIGSGTYARTFPQAERVITTTRTGPRMEDIVARSVFDADSGVLVDQCNPDNAADSVLHRRLPKPRSIRVEVTVQNARKMFEAVGADIAEVYSPPRNVQEAVVQKYHGVSLKPGWSLDLTRNDPATNKPWDFTKPDCRERAMSLVTKSKPFMLIGSPPCTAFSQLQRINNKKRPAEVVAKEVAEGRMHCKFAMKLYDAQAREGRYFLHEHPHTAASWALKE